jgi:hypothetical protein
MIIIIVLKSSKAKPGSWSEKVNFNQPLTQVNWKKNDQNDIVLIFLNIQ